MPSNPAERYSYRYCTSDMAPAINVLLRSGRRVLAEEMQSGFGYAPRLIIVQAVRATT